MGWSEGNPLPPFPGETGDGGFLLLSRIGCPPPLILNPPPYPLLLNWPPYPFILNIVEG